MTRFVETLECRRLLSGTLPMAALTDMVKLVSDAHTAQLDFRQFVATLHADVQVLRKDVMALPHSSSNMSMLGKLRGDGGHAVALLKSDIVHLARADSVAARKVFVDAIRLSMHPTNATLQAELATDLTTLQNAGAAPMAQFMADATAQDALIGSDLNSLVAANSSDMTLAHDVQHFEADAAGFISAAQMDLNTVQADVTALVTALS